MTSVKKEMNTLCLFVENKNQGANNSIPKKASEIHSVIFGGKLMYFEKNVPDSQMVFNL